MYVGLALYIVETQALFTKQRAARRFLHRFFCLLTHQGNYAILLLVIFHIKGG